MVYKKRIAIVLVLIAALLAHFWLGSRYPAIDEKAAMAGEAVLEDVLSFEATIRPDAGDPLWKRVGVSTVNWIMTNRQGMTFGVLLASLVLTLLHLRPVKASAGPTWRGILKGIFIGTPLGVCVNCAAPIAYGMNQRGVRHETSLAAMFASPSLNVVVVTMMFSLLPLYMALTKVLVTFVFLLLVLPLVLRLLKGEAAAHAAVPVDIAPRDAGEASEPPVAESWPAAVLGLARDWWKQFLFIVVRTVPLMILAGFLGAAMANLLPMETFSQWGVSLGAMTIVALLGTFAPVPIAFDVVVIQALLVAGLPAQFAVVLLITLGMYSIYPFLIVSRMMTLRFAVVLFAAVSVLGLGSGYFAGAWQDYRRGENLRILQEQFASGEGAAPGRTRETAAASPTTAGLRETNDETAPRRAENATVDILPEPYRSKSPPAERLFARKSGRAFGLVPAELQLLDRMFPFSQGRGIAAGDFDGDGWPDLAVAENSGLQLFRNHNGERFEKVPLEVPGWQPASSLVVAFVDIDNDGCLDLYSGNFGRSDHLLINDCAGFSTAKLVELPKLEGLMTQAATFADYDRDGDLDLFAGNWFFLIPRKQPSARNVNYFYENLGDLRFDARAMDEIHGATLSVLMTDFDGDGHSDLIVGNDYQEPDIFYRGRGGGEFTAVEAGGIVPFSALATMSIDTADIDNDLDMDLFLSGKVNDFSLVRHRDSSLEERRRFVLQRRKAFREDYCAAFEHPDDRSRCAAYFEQGELIRGTRLAPCLELRDERRRKECMLTLEIKNALIHRDWSVCEVMPADEFPVHRAACDAYKAFNARAVDKQPGYQYLDLGAIPQSSQGNVLLVQQEDGRFVGASEQMGVFDGHWAWNAKFADVDHDEWQDLYLVNGWWLETSMYSNDFFHNEGGTGFREMEAEFGLESPLKQHAFVYFDFDRDGDLDILTRSLAGDMQLYVNGLQSGNSVMFRFRDEVGNHFGIGARVTIHYGADGKKRQLRELKSGGGFVSFDQPVLHFGLGPHERVERTVIEWADGSLSEIDRPLPAGHVHTIRRTVKASTANASR